MHIECRIVGSTNIYDLHYIRNTNFSIFDGNGLFYLFLNATPVKFDGWKQIFFMHWISIAQKSIDELSKDAVQKLDKNENFLLNTQVFHSYSLYRYVSTKRKSGERQLFCQLPHKCTNSHQHFLNTFFSNNSIVNMINPEITITIVIICTFFHLASFKCQMVFTQWMGTLKIEIIRFAYQKENRKMFKLKINNLHLWPLEWCVYQIMFHTNIFSSPLVKGSFLEKKFERKLL